MKKQRMPTCVMKKRTASLSVPFSTNKLLRRATFSYAVSPIGSLVLSEKLKKKDLAISSSSHLRMMLYFCLKKTIRSSSLTSEGWC